MHLIKKKPLRTRPGQQGVQQDDTDGSRTAAAPRSASAAPIEQRNGTNQGGCVKMIEHNRTEPNRNGTASNVKSVAPEQKRATDARPATLIDNNRYEELVRRVGEPRRRIKKVDVAFAAEMHRYGFSHEQIALYYHCSVSTIRRRLKRAARRQ